MHPGGGRELAARGERRDSCQAEETRTAAPAGGAGCTVGTEALPHGAEGISVLLLCPVSHAPTPSRTRVLSSELPCHIATPSASLSKKYESSRASLSPVARDWLLDFHIEKPFLFYDPVARRRENFLPMITKFRRISKTNQRSPTLTIIVFMNFAMIFQMSGT